MMRDTKRRLELFSFYDRTGIQEHLEAMAAKGWMLEKMGNYGWRYRRIEPKKLHFAVTYFPKASEFDPGPGEAQQSFQDYCLEAGWQPVARWAQMQVFVSQAEDPVPLETDAVTQVRTVHQAMKANFLIGQAVLLVLAVFQLGFSLWRLLDDPIDTLSSTSNLAAALCWVLLLVLCLTELASYFGWYRRAKAAAEQSGSFVETHSHRRLQTAVLALAGLILLFWLGSLAASWQQLAVGISSLLMIAALFFLVNLIKNTLKRNQVSTGVNRAVTLVSCVVLSFALMGALVFCALKLVRGGWLEDSRPSETYTYKGMTWHIYHDDIPLRIEDLLETDYDSYSTERTEAASPLLAQTACTQRARMDALSEPELAYTVTEVKVPFLYGLCKTALLERYWYDSTPEEFRDSYRLLEGVSYGGSQVYRLYDYDGTPRDFYLLCWPDRMAELRFYWEPTPEQLAIAAETLQNA